MNHLRIGGAAVALSLAATAGQAAGIDRSYQSILPIFAPDDSGSVAMGLVMPSVTGEDNGGTDYDVGENYTVTTMSYTNAVGPRFNYSVIFDQPYGVDVSYDADPATSLLGGTGAALDAEAATVLGRYKISDRFSVFAGIKAERVSARVNLNGLAYQGAISTAAVARGAGVDAGTLGAALRGDPAAVAALGGPATVGALGAQVGAQSAAFAAGDGYQFDMKRDTKPGYVLGAAYEIPDIALRVSGAYSFEIEHDGEIRERLFGGTFDSDIEYVTPASFNLDFQTGIAADTLLLASYRWTDFSAVDVIPTVLNSDLVNLEDGHRYSLGLGRRFSEDLAGSVTFIYEPSNDDGLVSPLAPTDGLFGVTLGSQYNHGPVTFSGGVNYSWLGDADIGVANTQVASFEDNHVWGVGFRAEMSF
ncbi:outer membrane protein transport protein [Roseivivax sp. CAU 1761]